MTEKAFDLIVIGSGPGGYVAALRAARLGLSTAVVEREHWGGVCLNWGCIPTKAFLRSAHLIADLRAARSFGVNAQMEASDFGAAMRRSRAVADRLSKGVRFLLEREGVAMVQGHGRLGGRAGDRLRVTVETAPQAGKEASGKALDRADRAGVAELFAAKVILASGSRPRALPALPFDGVSVFSSREALALERAPRRLLIVGAGAIGMEFAEIFHAFGSEVTVVEMLAQPLPGMEPECASEVARAFAKRGVRIRCGQVVTGIVREGEAWRCRLEPAAQPQAKGDSRPGEAASQAGSHAGTHANANASEKVEEVIVDQILVAAGVVPNREDVGLETIELANERGYLRVDGYGRTSAPGVYAIGDLTGPPLLAHAASAEGLIAAEHAAREGVQRAAGSAAASVAGTSAQGVAADELEPLEREWIPGVVYTDPEFASVGLTEEAARSAHGEIRIGKFPFRASGRAAAEGWSNGFVKVLLDSKGEHLLGAHIVGRSAGELIAELALIGRCRIPVARAIATVHAHPTLMEAVPEAIEAALGRAIHV